MLLTEEEAKEKWCPQLEDQRDRCIGCACMAWRWHLPPMEIVKVRDSSQIKMVGGLVREYQGNLYLYDYDSCDEIGPFVRLYRENKAAQRQGFCGLAVPIE